MNIAAIQKIMKEDGGVIRRVYDTSRAAKILLDLDINLSSTMIINRYPPRRSFYTGVLTPNATFSYDFLEEGSTENNVATFIPDVNSLTLQYRYWTDIAPRWRQYKLPITEMMELQLDFVKSLS